MDRKWNNFIDHLKKVDLKLIEVDELLEMLELIPNEFFQKYRIRSGSSIVRVRPNIINAYFFYPCEIAHPSGKKVIERIKMGRANDSKESVFYGCIPLFTETNSDRKNFNNIMLQIVSLSETGQIVGSPETPIEMLFTLGHWNLKSDINVIILPHFEPFLKKNEYANQVHKLYLNSLEKNHPEIKEDALKISEFFASEYAKPVERTELFNYKISVAFRKLQNKRGFAGIVYPSVKGSGATFNVVLNPLLVENNTLQLQNVIVFRVIRQDKENMPFVDLYAKTFQPDGKFIYQDSYRSPQNARREFNIMMKNLHNLK